MAEFFAWNEEDYGLGVAEMDAEHKVLLRKMSDLHSLWVAKGDVQSLRVQLDDLVKYTMKHFRDEEAYLEKIQFEGRVTHKIIHQSLLRDIQKFVDEFKMSGVLTDRFFHFLKVWLATHIRGIDRKYSPRHKSSAA